MFKTPKTKRTIKSFISEKLGIADEVSFKYLWGVIIRRYWHGLFAFVYLLLVLEFRLLEKYIVPTTWVSCAIDKYIPFMPIFLIPYSIWYVAIPFMFFRLCFSDRGDFLKYCVSTFAGMFIAMLLFIVFPNGQTLRPVITDDGILSNAVRTMIYSRDTNTNSLPSIHVLNQVSIHIGVCKSKLWADKKAVKNISLVVTVLVCASTVFIKQHSFLDVVFALILSYPIYLISYKLNWVSLFPKKLRARIKRWEKSEIKY